RWLRKARTRYWRRRSASRRNCAARQCSPTVCATPLRRLCSRIVGGAPSALSSERERSVRLVVVRHGATANNLAAQFTGQMDVPLSPLGERQSLALATALAQERFDALISSDLQRACATLSPLAEALEQPYRRDPALREISVGVWEGQTGAAVRERYPGEIE